MLNAERFAIYQEWCEKAEGMKEALAAMTEDERDDAFYCDMEFGTAGLRGIMGAGTNRMNIYTVGHASQGLASYVCQVADARGESVEGGESANGHEKRVAISFDSRLNSEAFAKRAAQIFAANGIHVFLYRELMPTPCLSFAVRYYHCDAGVMVTASHNPSTYNGYKVYNNYGCQMTTQASADVTALIEATDTFAQVALMPFEDAFAQGLIEYVGQDCIDAFNDAVLQQSQLAAGDAGDAANLKIVYSPLNGCGLKPVTRALKDAGFTQVTLVKEQALPDGNFPTCPYPNPEIKEAMALGVEYAQRENADLFLATDPDSDRVGIAQEAQGEWRLFTGNETALLLLDFVCSQRKAVGTLPKRPVLVKTIVSTGLADVVAASYGLETISVLTGFKYIGEQINALEDAGEEERFVFGFEESYGYLAGTHDRDKDAVVASLLICQMTAYYKARGLSLFDRLQQLYAQFGYYLDTQKSYAFAGQAGFETMARIMNVMRSGLVSIGGYAVSSFIDYLPGVGGLPSSDVVKFFLQNESTLVVRPSGTEPKLKVYYSIKAASLEQAQATKVSLEKGIEALIASVC